MPWKQKMWGSFEEQPSQVIDKQWIVRFVPICFHVFDVKFFSCIKKYLAEGQGILPNTEGEMYGLVFIGTVSFKPGRRPTFISTNIRHLNYKWK